MIKVGLIGMGIGQKHFEAINGYRDCKVISILEKDSCVFLCESLNFLLSLFDVSVIILYNLSILFPSLIFSVLSKHF